MCGIAGQLFFDQTRPVRHEELSRMVNTLVHRGPDDEGYFVQDSVGLGMRRLAIIDLTAGQQPIANEDRSIWVVLNGEIYNFPDLRHRLLQKGHIFRTNSDTEVLVHLYEEEGDEFPRSLNGMYAFALWDQRQRKLILVRDRLGVKPLYYALLPDRLVFASEIKALLQAEIPRDIDRQALHHYLSLGYIPAPWSIFQAVKKLEAGHLMTVQGAQCTIKKYWDLPTNQEHAFVPQEFQRLQEEFRALLIDSIKIRLLSDVPLGVFLSGGIDSSTIVALLKGITPFPTKTFSIGFDDASYNELPYARTMAERFATDHHEHVVTPKVLETLPVLSRYFDEPFADSSAVPTYDVCRLARQDVTVALGGDGADEIFAGYYTHQADRLLSFYRWIPVRLRTHLLARLSTLLPTSSKKLSWDFKLRRFLHGGGLPPDQAHFAWKEWYSEEFKQSLYATPDLTLAPTFTVFQRHYSGYGGSDALNRHLYVDTKISLPDDILVKVDRMSMATSLEVRGPFLDYRIAEFMTRLPGTCKMPGFALKNFLKQVIRHDLPPEILRGKKRGFNAPIASWLKNDLSEFIRDLLGPDRVKRQGLFSPHIVQRMVNDHQKGTYDWSRNLWILLMFSLWHEQYMGSL